MISVAGKVLTVDRTSVSLEYPVLEAFETADRIVVLYEPSAYTGKTGQFRNLIAINRAGTVIWRAELPTTQSGDRYYKIASHHPLRAYSIYSQECEIDVVTGKIRSSEFFK